MRLCDNSCPAFFTNDGVCDDGGEGSRWNNCGQLGTDCADCGERWLAFSCPAHPRLRRNGGPCTCKVPQAIKCRGFKGCTPAWMNSHKYVC